MYYLDCNNNKKLFKMSIELLGNQESELSEEGLTFGKALEAVKDGKLAYRKNWGDKGMFIFIRPSNELSADVVINFVLSLPQSVKNYYNSLHSHTIIEENAGLSPKNKIVTFSSYLCMKDVDDNIINGWVASQADILANDWVILTL